MSLTKGNVDAPADTQSNKEGAAYATPGQHHPKTAPRRKHRTADYLIGRFKQK